MSDDLDIYTAKVSSLDLVTPFEQVVNTIGIIEDGMRRLRELKAEAEAVAIEQLKTSGPQYVGSVKYWAGASKDHKCRDVRKAVMFMLESLDIDTLNDCLSSGAIKPGAFRKAVEAINQPEVFEQHFETVEKWGLKDNDKTPKLQKLDTAFLR